MKRLTLFSLAFSLTVALSAIDKQYVYTQISQAEGLTSTVNSIYKEKDGAVWIGTPNGLYSFNGYKLNNYNDILEDSRRVNMINMDMEDNLWVLTDKHLFRRTKDSKTFKRVSRQEETYHCIKPDKTGLWVGGANNIYRYSYQDSTLMEYCKLPEEFACRSIEILDSGRLLCCSNNGKIILNVKDCSISHATFGQTQEVSATMTDSRGRIWIAFYNKGIEIFDKDGNLLKSYNSSNSTLSNDIVLCLAEKGSKVLVGTDGGGINIINPDSNTIQVLSHISGDSSSLPAHSIKSLHVDQYGDIWAGSIRKGLISISQSDMHFYTDSHLGLSCGLSDPTVLCLHHDKNTGCIWIGTDGEGVNRYDPKTSRFTHYNTTFKTKVCSIADYSRTELAISIHGDNIWIFDKSTGAIRPLKLTDNDFKYSIRHSGRSMNLVNEKNGNLLLYSNIIFRYENNTGRCIPIKTAEKEESESDLFVLGRSQDGIWFHNDTNIYFLYDNGVELIAKGSHANGNIKCGHLASNGTIWLATDEGLCCFDTHTSEFRHIKTRIFTDANSVICDNRSRVWVGTEKRLVAYLAESGTFAVFGESDGAVPNEYLPKTHLLAANGDVYLGGVQGLLHIRNNYNIDASEKPILKLDEVNIDDAKMCLNKGTVLKAERDAKLLNINISVHERDMFRHRVLRFSLADRTYETVSPTFTLKQMPKPGKYPIHVSCTKRNGKWTDPVYLMTLNVPYPWFVSWWFISFVALAILLSYLAVIYILKNKKDNELKMVVKEKEQKVYEEKVNMLINISHELRTPLTLIMAPLKRVLKGMNQADEGYPAMSRIYRQSRRMQSLLDMVLDLQKMEEGGRQLKLENTNFNAWIAACADDIVNEEKAEGINIIYDFDPNIQTVECDKQKCDIVLMNILINAIKHSSPGDTITIRTELTGSGMARAYISDQGPGLSADVDPDKVFVRFYQSNNEKYGSGIGLSYSKILVELHGGNIGVYNNSEIGATFWWEIPTCPSMEGNAEVRPYLNELLGHSSEAESSANTEISFNTAGMRLMLVDDSQDLLDFLREALSGDFAEIITATGGKEAMERIRTGKLPDAIVSDVNMPEGDGFWLCNEIKGNEKYSHIPFVLLTARGEQQSQSESYRLGADGFLAKPFETDTLLELLRGLLKRKAEIRKKYLDNTDMSETDYGSEEERFILQLNNIIAEHIANPSLDQQLICRELGVSRALLYNRMKAITGAGTKEYIIKIRIEKAKALIETTSLTIAEISNMTGFASQSYFSTAFKNYEGMTPSQYKAAHKDAQNAPPVNNE